MREAELLAILDAGPIGAEALAALSGSRRRLAQAGIDALIDYLDATTPDADLEPSLGVPEHLMGYGWAWVRIDRACSQAHWAKGGRNDLEDEHDGREPDVDDEEGFDREDDPAECGIADMDGLCEQVQAYDGRLPWSVGGYVA